MNRFENILFVYSGQKTDASVLGQALQIAKTNKAKLSLMATYEPLTSTGKLFLSKDKLEKIYSALEETMHTEVIGFLEGKQNFFEKIIIVPANTNLEIIYKVLEYRFDLVIKAKEGLETNQGLSSLDMRLLRKCPCPVWIINKPVEKSFSRIVAAIDPSPTEAERVKLQYEIMKLATSLAQREKATLDILYAWEFYSEATLKGPRFNMTDAEITELAEKESAQHAQWLEETVEPFESSGHTFKTHLLRGSPSKTILDFIAGNDCDLLVMGTVARTGIPGLIIGNTAETVLSQADCSILTIKPSSFKSPVSLQ